MTEPSPPPVPLGWPDNNLVWCSSCAIHLALATKPLCPVCLDERARGLK